MVKITRNFLLNNNTIQFNPEFHYVKKYILSITKLVLDNTLKKSIKRMEFIQKSLKTYLFLDPHLNIEVIIVKLIILIHD